VSVQRFLPSRRPRTMAVGVIVGMLALLALVWVVVRMLPAELGWSLGILLLVLVVAAGAVGLGRQVRWYALDGRRLLVARTLGVRTFEMVGPVEVVPDLPDLVQRNVWGIYGLNEAKPRTLTGEQIPTGTKERRVWAVTGGPVAVRVGLHEGIAILTPADP
jgi:hypothetical protein